MPIAAAPPRGFFGRIADWFAPAPKPPEAPDRYDGAKSPAYAHLIGDTSLRQFRVASTAPPSTLSVRGIHYQQVSGRPVVLGDGAIVEGSIDHGGIQPHYVVALDHPSLKRLLAEARLIKDFGKGDAADKIRQVRDLVASALKNKAYDSKPYLQLLADQRKHARNADLGDFLVKEAGVCREHGMMLHLALKAAGFNSHYVYARVDQAGRVEDHGFALVEHDGTTWAVDAYNKNFDGLALADLQRGSLAGDKTAPWAATKRLAGCSVTLTGHPTYWLPVIALPAF